jgi:hypothetical protein
VDSLRQQGTQQEVLKSLSLAEVGDPRECLSWSVGSCGRLTQSFAPRSVQAHVRPTSSPFSFQLEGASADPFSLDVDFNWPWSESLPFALLNPPGHWKGLFFCLCPHRVTRQAPNPHFQAPLKHPCGFQIGTYSDFLWSTNTKGRGKIRSLILVAI